MMDLLNIPECCICNINIPLEKIYEGCSEKHVQSVLWYASLKPNFIKASAVINESVRYEEIQVIKIVLTAPDSLYDVARKLYKSIKYPCLIIFNYKNKYMLGACKFDAGKINYTENILRRLSFSHWVYPDLLSSGAKRMIDTINALFESQYDLLSLYTYIMHAIENYALAGTTRTHVDRILKDMLGSISAKKRDEIMKYCTPYQKHFVTDLSIATKYDKNKRTSNYVYSYDYEDIWYCLMQYESTCKIINARRYRDIEDLLFSIDTKLDEYENRW